MYFVKYYFSLTFGWFFIRPESDPIRNSKIKRIRTDPNPQHWFLENKRMVFQWKISRRKCVSKENFLSKLEWKLKHWFIYISGVCALVLAYHRHILAPHTNIFPLLNIPAKVIIIIQLKSGNGPVIEISLVLDWILDIRPW